MALNFANNNSLSAITSLPASISGGVFTLLQTQTASSSSTIDFTSGIDSTYKEFMLKFYDVHPSNDDILFQFNMSTDGGSNYNVTKTTTVFRSHHGEDGSGASLDYRSGEDLAQSTSNQYLCTGQGNGNDECLVGTINLFNPSSTTFVKHFIANFTNHHESNISQNYFIAGYANTTNAVNALQFSFGSGNIDSGTFKLYGVT